MDLQQDVVFSQTVQAALKKIVDGPQFSNSPRLQAFLTYVVEESLQGRAEGIVGKIIAQDVYGRDPADGSDNIVRVDARRVRRALAEYYSADGQFDPLKIHIDRGTYAPRFERCAIPADPTDADPRRRWWMVGGAGAACAVLALGVGAQWLWRMTSGTGPAVPPQTQAPRKSGWPWRIGRWRRCRRPICR